MQAIATILRSLIEFADEEDKTILENAALDIEGNHKTREEMAQEQRWVEDQVRQARKRISMGTASDFDYDVVRDAG